MTPSLSSALMRSCKSVSLRTGQSHARTHMNTHAHRHRHSGQVCASAAFPQNISIPLYLASPSLNGVLTNDNWQILHIMPVNLWMYYSVFYVIFSLRLVLVAYVRISYQNAQWELKFSLSHFYVHWTLEKRDFLQQLTFLYWWLETFMPNQALDVLKITNFVCFWMKPINLCESENAGAAQCCIIPTSASCIWLVLSDISRVTDGRIWL